MLTSISVTIIFIKKIFFYKDSKYLIKSPLYNAVDNSQTKIVSMLLKQPGIKVNEITKILKFVFFIISKWTFLNIKSLHLDFFYRAPLHIAVYGQNLEIIEMLLKHPMIDTTIIDDVLFLFVL